MFALFGLFSTCTQINVEHMKRITSTGNFEFLKLQSFRSYTQKFCAVSCIQIITYLEPYFLTAFQAAWQVHS